MSSLGDYDFEDIETRWMKRWEEMGLYKHDLDSEKPVFSIDTPPRYASGFLHMGHAKNYIEFEIIARAMRSLGYNVFFPVGYDDNGLPTEKYVEEKVGINKREVRREDFINRCKETSAELEEKMTEVFDRIGMSWDWDTFYQTIDDLSVKTAQKSFLYLYKEGDVYRNSEPTIWCPYHKTALAQAEVEDIERDTTLNYIYFESEDGEKIEIATTRPELLPSCVAVFVHPEDERYKDMVGKIVKVPLFGQEVPLMEGEEVDMEFGSGMVMICTFGDNTDIEMWKKYDLPLRISIDEEGRMNKDADDYEGMTIEEAREKIIEDLKDQELLFDQEGLHQSVGSCWRCDTPVEFIPTLQWFIRTLDYKDELLKLADKIDWYPSYYKHRYKDWVENLKWDWCISRQRYFGVPFPIWYCEECENIIAADEVDLPVDPRTEEPEGYGCDQCGSENLKPEMDVMDTWMTSSMTPQIALRWTEGSEVFEKNYPMTLRPQSHDIIRTWAFYTILKSYLHHGSIPWEEVMISGYVYTKEGEGMSSSRGTGISPEGIIEEYGADCLRYWAAGAGIGDDIVYKKKEVVRGRKILNKIWNASKLVDMHLDKLDKESIPEEIEPIDRWIMTKTKEIVDRCEGYYRDYDSSKVRRTISTYFKNEFCDDYLEMVKYRLYDGTKQQSALFTLSETLRAILKVMAPMVPFITEEIYQNLLKEEGIESIHTSNWPEINTKYIDEEAREKGDVARDITSEIRKWKSDKGIPLNEEIGKVRLVTEHSGIEAFKDDIKETVKATELVFLDAEDIEERAVDIEPNYSVMGPKYKDKAKKIFKKLESLDPEEVDRKIGSDEVYSLSLDDGTEVVIESEDINIRRSLVHKGEELDSIELEGTLVLVKKRDQPS